jgi:hypothetical protein
MDILGDLERFVATSLYPLRVPLAIAAALALAGLAWLAHRRGWLAAARRHPLRSGLVLAAILVVVAPPAWYLGSPLFVRTELQEAAPVADAASLDPGTPAPDAIPSARPSAAPTAAPPSAVPATPAPLTLAGTFRGADDFHFGRGTARLIETEPGRYVLRFEDFSVRNGPDLFVYLSPDPAGYADDAIELGRLRATDGSFNTPVPDGVDVAAARSVVIWCKEFAVLFAVAPLVG